MKSVASAKWESRKTLLYFPLLEKTIEFVNRWLEGQKQETKTDLINKDMYRASGFRNKPIFTGKSLSKKQNRNTRLLVNIGLCGEEQLSRISYFFQRIIHFNYSDFLKKRGRTEDTMPDFFWKMITPNQEPCAGREKMLHVCEFPKRLSKGRSRLVISSLPIPEN